MKKTSKTKAPTESVKTNTKGRKNRSYKRGDKPAMNNRNSESKIADQLSSLNDISWYNKNSYLLESVAKVPFPYMPGRNLPAPRLGQGGVSDIRYTPYPGVMKFEWIPSVGWSETNTSPASLAAKEMYARVREKFSGSLDEDAPDILIYILSMDAIFSYIGYLKRLYRTVNFYSPLNNCIPDALLRSYGMGENAIQHLRQHKIQLWNVINTLIAQSTKFTVPAVMDILNRHYWMSDNVYGDRVSPKTQFYCFVPSGFHKFQLDEDNQAGMLKFEMFDFPNDDTIIDYLFNYGDAMIRALAGSEDAYTINGHLMRAFENDPMFKVDYLEQNETLDVVYVPEVLTQIHNLRVAPNGMPSGAFDIKQDPTTNAIIHTPTVESDKAYAAPQSGGMFLDLPMEVPSVQDVTIATRLAPVYEAAGAGSIFDYQWKVYGGTEIVMWCNIYFVKPDGTIRNQQIEFVRNAQDVEGNTDVGNAIVQALLMDGFDNAPICYYLVSGNQDWGQGDELAFETVMCNSRMENTTVTDPENLKKLHEVCCYSEFNAYGIS